MFVVIYRWRIDPVFEERFARNWAVLTERIYAACGSLGSALLRDRDGTYVGIARWPDRESWMRCRLEAPELAREQQEAIVERFEPLELEMLDDRWRAGVRSLDAG